MSTTTTTPQRAKGRDSHATAFGGPGFFIKLILMMLIDASGVFIAYSAFRAGSWVVLIVDVVLLLVANWVYFSKRMLPAKYLMPGLVFLMIYQVFTMGYTAYVAFTNYGFGHNVTKPAAIDSIMQQNEKRVDGSAAYPVTIVSRGGELSMAVVYDGEPMIGNNDEPLTPAQGAQVDDDKVTSVDGYSVLSFSDMVKQQQAVTTMRVGISDDAQDGSLRTSDGTTAYLYKSALTYDAASDTMTDTTTGKVYTANPDTGNFQAADGTVLEPGWRVNVGFQNFTSMWSAGSSISQSLWKVAVWTFAFAFLTVVLNFFMGLFLALVFNSPRLRAQKILRALLILPYAFPAFLTFLLWRGLLNTKFGFINQVLLGGAQVEWLQNPLLAKIAVLFVNLWAGYPYMFLVCTGALQGIPTDCLESAEIDGAGATRVFRSITVPMVFIATAPLLISSFAFNFNNFNIIYLLTGGGPSFNPTAVPNLGATDILISAVYRVSGVDGSGKADYGMASAMSILIFIVVGVVSYISFRQTRKSEELI